jgi:hypothetical protein
MQTRRASTLADALLKKPEDRLLLGWLGSFVGGIDFGCGLGQNALDITGIRAGWGQVKILLIGFSAPRRQNISA